MRLFGGLLLIAVTVSASPDVVQRASELYQRTDYANSLRVLASDPAPDEADYLLGGKNYFMSGDYKKATDFFERALTASPDNSEYELWLGRAWGRRAETGGWMMAMSYASKARQCFEKAVALDPRNHEAKNDLFEFYLNAPGFLGGGLDKAEAAARGIANERPAEYEHEEAQLADRRKDYAAAEAHLRRAMELAPGELGRVLDLARYLAKRGQGERKRSAFRAGHKNGARLTAGYFCDGARRYGKPSQSGAGQKPAARVFASQPYSRTTPRDRKRRSFALMKGAAFKDLFHSAVLSWHSGTPEIRRWQSAA